MRLGVMKEVAAVNQGFEDRQVNFLVLPFAFCKEGGIFVLLAHDVDFCLLLFDRIVSLPAAEVSKLKGHFPESMIDQRYCL